MGKATIDNMLKKIISIDVYISVRQWNVDKLKFICDVKFFALIEVCYFDNKNVIHMIKVNIKEYVD